MRLWCRALVVMVFAVGFCAPPVEAGGTSDEIEAVLKAYRVAFNDRDARSLAALYEPRAFCFNNVLGPELLAESWARRLRKSNGLKTKTVRIDVSGDLAYLVATYRSLHFEESGNLVLCLKRQKDGSWRIVTDLWNETPAEPGVVPLVE